MHPSKILSFLNTTPKKRYSQNFLLSPHWAKKLTDIVLNFNNDEIWEIGGGVGALTSEISKRSKYPIKVFEVDEILSSFLKKTFPNIEVIEGDFLKFNINTSLKNIGLISNLPYHISSKILFKLLEYKHVFSVLVLTFQKEVAERLMAQPNTHSYGAISVIAQLNWRIRIIGNIPRNAFYPVPEVESTALEFINNQKIYHKNFYFILKKSFCHRRKKLVSNLKSCPFSVTKIENVFNELSLSSNSRAENLYPLDYEKLIYKLLD